MPSITLEFNECEMFTEDLDIARQFGTVKSMFEDRGMIKRMRKLFLYQMLMEPLSRK